MTIKKIHNVLTTKNLSIGYSSKKGNNEIAKNIDLELHKGELVCLV